MKKKIDSFIFGFLVLLSTISNATDGQNSGYFIFDDKQAYTERLIMIQKAKKEILVEYYSYGDDEPGVVFFAALAKAARNGIKVKVIADDLTKKISNSFLAAFQRAAADDQAFGNLEIQIYNPNSYDFQTFNNRDHAKMLVIDREQAIVGGRNIGGSYFGFNSKNYLDIDFLVEGQIVTELVENFYATFKSASVSRPANLNEFKPEYLDIKTCFGLEGEQGCKIITQKNKIEFEKNLQKITTAMSNVDHQIQLHSSHFDFSDKKYFGKRRMRLLSHQPDKLPTFSSAQMTNELNFLMAQADHEVKIITPYLVLVPDQIEVFKHLIQRGKKVKIITNSIISGDDIFALSAYRKDREMLRKLGIEIFEYTDPQKTLHAKIILIDHSISIVGTFNFDPRSAYLNREIGIMVSETSDRNQINQKLLIYYNELLTKSHRVIFDRNLDLNPIEEDLFESKKQRLMKFIEPFLPMFRNLI